MRIWTFAPMGDDLRPRFSAAVRFVDANEPAEGPWPQLSTMYD